MLVVVPCKGKQDDGDHCRLLQLCHPLCTLFSLPPGATQALAVLKSPSFLTAGPSWDLDSFPHFCKLPSSVISFSRKLLRASACL